MAAPTKACDVKIVLANLERSKHGAQQPSGNKYDCPHSAKKRILFSAGWKGIVDP